MVDPGWSSLGNPGTTYYSDVSSGGALGGVGTLVTLLPRYLTPHVAGCSTRTVLMAEVGHSKPCLALGQGLAFSKRKEALLRGSATALITHMAAVLVRVTTAVMK